MALVSLRGDSLTHSKLYKQTHMKSYMTSKECSENTSTQQIIINFVNKSNFKQIHTVH